jgi:Predicted metal-dependent membrane protease
MKFVKTAGLILALLFVDIIAQTALLIPTATEAPVYVQAILTVFVSIVTFGLVLKVANAVTTKQSINMRWTFTWHNIITTIERASALLMIMLGIGAVTQSVTHMAKPSQNQHLLNTMMSQSWLMYVIVFVLAVLIAPVIEELIFRGVLMSVITKRYYLDVIISGLAFGFFHTTSDPSLVTTIPYIVLGVGLAIIYRRTNNLSASIATHMVYNGMVMLVQLLVLLLV